MRVLYVIDSLARSGGAEQSLVQLAGPLVDRGVHLDIRVLVDRPGLQDEARAAGATVEVVPGRGSGFGRVAALRRLIAGDAPDVVHTTLVTSDLLGRSAARLAGVPVVTSLVNIRYGSRERPPDRAVAVKTRVVHALDASTAQLAVRFHAITDEVADVMGRRLRIRRAPIDVVHRGRDPLALGRRGPARRAAARSALGVAEHDHLVLAVARHEHQKGLDVLIDAVAGLGEGTERPVRVAIAGRPGLATAGLRARIARHRLADRVQLLGTRDDIADLLCAADVFVLPSRWEGLAGSVIEAMALEAPIVVSDLPELREAAADVARYVAPGAADELARAVAADLADPSAAAERARRGRTRFERHFTVDRIADQMVSFYERSLAGRP